MECDARWVSWALAPGPCEDVVSVEFEWGGGGNSEEVAGTTAAAPWSWEDPGWELGEEQCPAQS